MASKRGRGCDYRGGPIILPGSADPSCPVCGADWPHGRKPTQKQLTVEAAALEDITAVSAMLTLALDTYGYIPVLEALRFAIKARRDRTFNRDAKHDYRIVFRALERIPLERMMNRKG